jgi:hypothetical protein
MPLSPNRLFCESCNWRGTVDDILAAPHPFDPEDTVSGCPQCREIGGLCQVCDEEGCWDMASCGTPLKDGGYRRTCHRHRPL